jgi:phosphate/sulfate permease/CYTH domain-containing protein
MLFLIFLSSGLFLGWSLGSNDAANIFGTAVGSRMVTFKRAAWIASIFVVIGAVFQGRGATETLSSLGSVDALAGAFTVALCAAITVFLMTRSGLPVSTSQAVVGAIVGWSAFTGNQTDYVVLTKIVSTWVTGPVLGLVFAALLFLLLRRILRRMQIHVIKLDSIIRTCLIIAGAFGAYSLGANNIANVMGVFVASAPNIELNFGLFVLDGVQILFLIGGIAISVGIFTYSHKVMQTVGRGILALTPEAALVVVLAQALVLFLFSSASFSSFLIWLGLPPLPLVPVSSTQVVVGAVLGIGLVKGANEIKGKVIGGIAIGWVATPVMAAIFTYLSLFFVQNVFGLTVTAKSPIVETSVALVDSLQEEKVFNAGEKSGNRTTMLTKNQQEMTQEIERKFLVNGDFMPFVSKQTRIVQGYLSLVPERTVRVRVKDDQGFLTVKGAGSESGATRYEWEKEIPVEEARELLKLCEPGVIDKFRYMVEVGKHTFEVDEFLGDNQGLIIAEVELQSEDEDFEKPEWLGKEVTGNLKYYNVMLVKNPYKNWKSID